MPPNHASIMEICLGLSVDEFWNKCIADDATVDQAMYYTSRGDQKFSINKWRQSQTPDELEYKPEKGVKIATKMVREHKVEI